MGLEIVLGVSPIALAHGRQIAAAARWMATRKGGFKYQLQHWVNELNRVEVVGD